jgi:hypothetical protein
VWLNWVLAVDTLLREFHDEKKASYKYFSGSKSQFLWQYYPQHHKQATLGIMAVNDVAESALGGCTRNVQTGNHIQLSSAAAVSNAKRNHVFDMPLPSRKRKCNHMNTRGIFSQFHPDIQKSTAGSGYEFGGWCSCSNCN